MAVSRPAIVTGLSPAVLEALRGTFARYPAIEQVLLFGSRARGDFDTGSDIDLAVLAPQMAVEEFARLWSDIDALPIAFKMDLLHFDTLDNPELKAQIRRHGLPIYP